MRGTRQLFVLVVFAALCFNCATEPEPLDRTQPEAVPKAIFDGTWHYGLTVTDASWDNRFTFIGEETHAYQGKAFKVRWEIAKDNLNAYMVPQIYRDSAGNPVKNPIGQSSLLLSFKITKHYDIRYKLNSTTREELNVIEENTDRPWDQREYMEVDWSQNLASNIWNPTEMDEAFGQLERQPVASYENVDFYSRGATPDQDVRINTRQWSAAEDPEVYAINIDTKESISGKLSHWYQLYFGTHMEPSTVRFRHSLRRAVPQDETTYTPLQYTDDLFRRFGYFRTEYEVYDPERHTPQESKKKYFINRWDISGDKQIAWYMSPATQEAVDNGDEDLKKILQDVCEAWNKTMQQATGRTDAIVVLKENERMLDQEGQQITRADGTKRWKYELGDLRYSFINTVFDQGLGQPLGYGPSTPDSDSGEIIHAAVNIYAGWVEYVVQRALDQYDVAAGHCTLENIKDGQHFNLDSGKCDGGTTTTGLNGPSLSETKASVAQGTNPSHSTRGKGLHFLSPALKTALWPKADIAKNFDRKLLRQELAQAKPMLKAQYDWEVTHPTTIDLNGFSTIAGTAYESYLLPQSNMTSLLPGGTVDDPSAVAALSPAGRLSPTALRLQKEQMIEKMAIRDEPIMFEPAIHAFVEEMKDHPRAEVERTLRQWVYYTTTLHEMGHTLGLRHNFSGSADRSNFPSEYETARAKYWDQIEGLRTQYQEAINAGDAAAYESYVAAADDIASTHDRYSSSSIMDYVGDWMDWSMPVRSYDHAALMFGYGNKVEVKNEGGAWEFVDYVPGDLSQTAPYDQSKVAASGRQVRYYMFCSDEKTFDDAFCTPFDRGVTATEIVRNFISDAQVSYFFRNFKRDSTSFDHFRQGYYSYKWMRQYYMYAKPFAQMTLSSMRYQEFWPSIFEGIDAMIQGPEAREMKPGYRPDGGEDLLRASLLYYYYLLFDVLMRPDYGYHQLSRDTNGSLFWEKTTEEYLEDGKPRVFIPAGAGWGFSDRWDVQQDPQQYYEHIQRIGVEVDKVIALEVLSIPMALNTPLGYEKANGNSYWSSLWTNNGVQLWNIVRGLITDNFSHLQNPWCLKCDAACQANSLTTPPTLKAYPIDYLEGLGASGIFSSYPLPQGKNRCGPDEHPVEPALDDLFAIKPMFYAIAGASHPWYHNALADKLDSQVKGGNHRFDIPEGTQAAEFTNPSGTKTYQAVQTDDGLSVSYALAEQGQRISNRINLYTACRAWKDYEKHLGAVGTYDRTCTEVLNCYKNTPPAYCEEEGWSSSFTLEASKYRDVERIEAMLIMMQDMIDLAGHYQWRIPGFLSE